MSKYDFGEKTTENIKGKELPVWKTPKYEFAKKKVIEMLESDKYKGILEPSDFWILMNTYANGTKMMYSGLIISHNGCLKINDTLDEKLKFNPECITIDTRGYEDELVFHYCNKEQGIYEVGEVSKDNCKNDYPYAMALKRCFDRVVLKNSKLAYAGVYSDSEAEDFKENIEETNQRKEHKVVELNEEQKDRLELEARCREFGIDLEEPSIKNYIAVSLKKSSGKEELDEKFNLGIYNNILAKLIERKEGNK
jgi:hypothetical protein